MLTFCILAANFSSRVKISVHLLEMKFSIACLDLEWNCWLRVLKLKKSRFVSNVYWILKWETWEIPWHNLQNVTNNPDGPHVGETCDWLVTDNFWSDEFRCSKQNANGFIWIQLARQSEIDQLNSVRCWTLTKNVLRLSNTIISKLIFQSIKHFLKSEFNIKRFLNVNEQLEDIGWLFVVDRCLLWGPSEQYSSNACSWHRRRSDAWTKYSRAPSEWSHRPQLFRIIHHQICYFHEMNELIIVWLINKV